MNQKAQRRIFDLLSFVFVSVPVWHYDNAGTLTHCARACHCATLAHRQF
nr:MAG TPA: hypothetical protein [Caudoviricetes sp.]